MFRIAVALSDSATLYCGTESGVVFKTTNHGELWEACAPEHNFGGSIYSIAIHPTDKNIVYVGGVEIATGYVMKINPWKVYFTDASTRIMPREMNGTVGEDFRTRFSDKKPHEVLRINGEIATDPRYRPYSCGISAPGRNVTMSLTYSL